MATSVATSAVYAIDQIALDGKDLRLAAGVTASGFNQAGGLSVWSGIRPSGGTPGLCVWTSGLSFTVKAFQFAVQGTDASDQGVYLGALNADTVLTTVAADSVNPRWDLVGVKIVDNGDGTSTSNVVIVTGAPSSTPADPNPGSNFLPIARLVVPATATDLAGGGGTHGSIQDLRRFFTAAGGIVPVSNSAAYPTAGPAGTFFYDLSTGAFGVWNGTGNVFARSQYLRVTRADGNTLASSSNHTPSQILWNSSADMNQDFGVYPSGSPLNFSLPSAGLWLGYLRVIYDPNTSGIRRIHIKQGSTFWTHSRNAANPVTNADSSHCSFLFPIHGNAGDSIGFYTDHDSGSTRTLSGQVAALVKIF
jgi:hypothetical protein